MTPQIRLSGRKIQVVGVVGAGKTTFARQLGRELSIPACELDPLFHQSRAGGAPSAEDAQRTVQAFVTSNDDWIIDGNHWVQLQNITYDKATDILWVDTPLLFTLWRVVTRTIWEIIAVPGVLRRELSGNSLITTSLRIRARKYANWRRRSEVDTRWKRLTGWSGCSDFLAGLNKPSSIEVSRALEQEPSIGHVAKLRTPYKSILVALHGKRKSRTSSVPTTPRLSAGKPVRRQSIDLRTFHLRSMSGRRLGNAEEPEADGGEGAEE